MGQRTYLLWQLVPMDEVLALMRAGLLPSDWDPRLHRLPESGQTPDTEEPQAIDREMRRRPRGRYACYLSGGPAP